MAKKILLVDDDALMRKSLAFNLNQAGYRVNTAANAEDALAQAKVETPDLILLDIVMPGMDGLQALRRFKEQTAAPVIFLTAMRRNLDEALGLEMGADDYVTKPFDIDVLLAHIKAVFRRAGDGTGKPESGKPIELGDLTIDPGSRTASLSGQSLKLSRREFDLLHALALEPNRVMSVDELLDRVWGAEFVGQPQVVYVHIRWLREKIEADPEHPQRIVSVRGVGYKLLPQG